MAYLDIWFMMRDSGFWVAGAASGEPAPGAAAALNGGRPGFREPGWLLGVELELRGGREGPGETDAGYLKSHFIVFIGFSLCIMCILLCFADTSYSICIFYSISCSFLTVWFILHILHSILRISNLYVNLLHENMILVSYYFNPLFYYNVFILSRAIVTNNFPQD